MDEKAQTKLVKDTIEVVGSFQEAAFQAGGVVQLWRLSVSELIRIMALNGLRFVYKGNE